MNKQAPNTETAKRLLNTLEDACQRLRLSRTTLWRLLRDGKLLGLRVGKRTMIPEDELIRFLAYEATPWAPIAADLPRARAP